MISTPPSNAKGFGTRTPAAASLYSASTSADFHWFSSSCLPKRVPFSMARARRLLRTVRPSWYAARWWKVRSAASL
jgi:hypothetical protein